ncbi:MAG: CRTAC1 family protein [Planctomycetes bacterium]|nr:CRTAC1 family protein [Planctomycetota bacterium]
MFMRVAGQTLLLLTAGLVAVRAQAQVCVDGVCFVDRGLTGEIPLGALRGGIAVLDYDEDGYQDLVVGDLPGRTNRLFRNVPDSFRPGNRTFVDVTPGSGLDDAEGTSTFSFGIAVADYDNDGDSDIYMTASSGLLYRNEGGGQFTNVSLLARVRGFPALSASWNDFDLDGYVDLMLVASASSGPTLLRNNGDGTFSDATSLVVLPEAVDLGTPYGHMWMDYNGDAYADCFVLNTIDRPLLLENQDDGQGGRRLVDVAPAANFTVLGPAPMGIAAGDYDDDGDFDLAISDALAGTYYENLGGAMEFVIPFGTGFSWGVMWLDFDNDADLDHYQCGRYSQPRVDSLVRNRGGGVFDDISAALNGGSFGSQHSVQIDFNNDGRQDIITLNPGTAGQNVSVYENITSSNNHWIALRLRGDGTLVNRDAVGAVVRLTAGGRTQVRQVVSGSSTTSTEDLRLHFGLGAATVVDEIEVLWPYDAPRLARTHIYAGPLAADQIVTLAPAPQDCNGNQVFDALDIASGTSQDCNVNSFPDECDIALGVVFDANGNVIPDECEPFTPTNRYLVFSVPIGGAGRGVRAGELALRVTSPTYPALVKWVNPPIAPGISRLGCGPLFYSWGGTTVQVADADITPNATYVIEATADGTSFAPLAEVSTVSRWGDTVGAFDGDRWLGPNGVVNFNDVLAALHAFQRIGPPISWADVDGQAPNGIVNFSDVQRMVMAFRREPYPFPGPTPCP